MLVLEDNTGPQRNKCMQAFFSIFTRTMQ
jgi:hypothetical protein